jgi:hypothetical protein
VTGTRLQWPLVYVRSLGGRPYTFPGVPVLFEEQPIVLLVLIVAVVEGWIRVREPLFKAADRLFRRRAT